MPAMGNGQLTVTGNLLTSSGQLFSDCWYGWLHNLCYPDINNIHYLQGCRLSDMRGTIDNENNSGWCINY